MQSAKAKMRKVRLLTTMKLKVYGQDFYQGYVYDLPAKQAAEFVTGGVAVYVRPTRLKKVHQSPRPKGRDWKAKAIEGDAFQWQVKLKLPALSRPFIKSKYKEPWRRSLQRSKSRRGPEEVGGDEGPTPQQERALDFLVENEPAICAQVLKAVAGFAKELRSTGGWEAFDDPPGIDAVMPRGMTPEQAAERIEISRVQISSRSRGGISYIEVDGECAWDTDHGFTVVLHRTRIVDVSQQGAGWTDRGLAQAKGQVKPA